MTVAAPSGELAHERGRAILRRKAAGVSDHESLRHGVHAEREDHRRGAQVGDADAVDEADGDPAQDAEGNGERDTPAGVEAEALEEPGKAGGHHAADGDGPRDRQVNVTEENDEHDARCDDAEK